MGSWGGSGEAASVGRPGSTYTAECASLPGPAGSAPGSPFQEVLSHTQNATTASSLAEIPVGGECTQSAVHAGDADEENLESSSMQNCTATRDNSLDEQQHASAHMYTQQQGAARNRTLKGKRKNSSEIITQIQKIAHKIMVHFLQEHIKKSTS